MITWRIASIALEVFQGHRRTDFLFKSGAMVRTIPGGVCG